MEAAEIVGYRFHPSDEDVVNHHLKRKILHKQEKKCLIPDLNIYKYDPEDLPGIYNGRSVAKFDARECFFFCPRNSTSPKGRIKRKTESGFWKDTSRKRTIKAGKTVGTKRILVYYIGKQKGAIKSEWVMHEYHLDTLADDDAVDLTAFSFCRIKRKPEKKVKSPASKAYSGSPSTSAASPSIEFQQTNKELQVDDSIISGGLVESNDVLYSESSATSEQMDCFDVDKLFSELVEGQSESDYSLSSFELELRFTSVNTPIEVTNTPSEGQENQGNNVTWWGDFADEILYIPELWVDSDKRDEQSMDFSAALDEQSIDECLKSWLKSVGS